MKLFEQTSDKQQAMGVLKEMIVRKWSITDDLFQALLAKRTTKLSNLLHNLGNGLQHTMNQTKTEQQLSRLISQITGENNLSLQQLNNQMYVDAQNRNYQTFNLFKATHMIDDGLSYREWQTFWLNNQNHDEAIIQPPFHFDLYRAIQVLSAGSKISDDIQQQAQLLISKWSESNLSIRDGPLKQVDYQRFKEDIQRQLLPLLSHETRQFIQAFMENKPASLQQLNGFLEDLSVSRTNVLVSNATDMPEAINLTLMNPKETFLTHIQRVLNQLGIAYEHELVENMTQQEHDMTIKSLLMQIIFQPNGRNHEQAQQLLHFLNGLQLESIQETTHLIQANLQIPGDRIGLNDDLFLEFESKKTPEGKINPDYCRIVFYLDLAYLKQTVIDMSIHNRLVSLTIYAEQEGRMKQLSESVQPILKERLSGLDYKLTSVALKPLRSNQERLQPKKQHLDIESTYEGIDFKV